MASDTWLTEYEACASLGQELMVKITERNKNSRTSSAYTKLSSQVRVGMKKFSGEVNKLKQNLIRASSSYHILDGNEHITVSVDAGWQKRGSGRTYDSLTGHCSMVGIKTGKLLDVQVRSTVCRICKEAEKRGSVPRKHTCRKNFEGSSKSMEPDMVVDMVSKARQQGININTIVGDDDTTTIARLRSKVDSSIKKRSDRNHVRKLFGNSLYSLKKDHPSLSAKVITYLQKCFNYMVAQGKGNAEKIKEGLPSLSKHPFGDHSYCNKEWCRFIENSGPLKYKSLPHGKPLVDKSLQTALEAILNTFANNAEKLAFLESTQSNESFNKSVASKAPKSRHYGGSSSLNYRISATAAQKNKGHKYLVDVNAKAGLSPGVHTKRLCLLRDMAARKRKAIAITRQAKLRRIELKSIRHQKTTSSELREGTCYETGTDLVEETINVTEIPAPRLPIIEPVRPTIQNVTEIYMDLEATGLENYSTQREVDRRQMMIDNLITKEKQINEAFKIEGDTSRYNLIGTDTFGSNDPWGVRDEPEDFHGQSNLDIRTQQQSIIEQQDRGLESLSHVISRQKQMAVDIGDEVDNQNVLIDEIGDHMDRTGERLIKETRHIKIVDKKSASCGYWIVIVLLFVAIIVIVAVPS